MHSMRRLEGASDPDDMMAVAAVTCPVCRIDGVLVLSYGPAASAEHADVLLGLRDERGAGQTPPDAATGETIDQGLGLGAGCSG